MNSQESEAAKKLFIILYGGILSCCKNEESLTAYYKLLTGYEALDNLGNRIDVPLNGPFLGWLIETLTKKKNALHQLIEKNTKGKKPETPPYENPIKSIHFTGEDISSLLEYASHNHIAWKATAKLAAIFLEENRQLPDNLRLFAIQVLTGQSPKKIRGKDKHLDLIRNAGIVNGIEQLKRNGYGPVSKSSRDSKTLTLCDAVSSALKILGFSLSYSAVKTIYERFSSYKGKIHPYRLIIELNSNLQSP